MKAIIIGSGLGGLACGAILAKNGYEVTVLEQGSAIGGCLQCFKRKGKKFETGMHYVGSVGDGQTVGQMFKYLEIDDKVRFSPLEQNRYDTISINGERFYFARGRRAFVDQMAERFPDQKDNLEKFFDLLEALAKESTLSSPNVSQSFSPILTEYQLRSVNEVIASIITDPLLQKVLVGNLPLFAGEQDKTPFLNYAFIMNSYNHGAYRIVGGSDHVADALQQTIERYGGKVITRQKVTRVKCDDHQATSVIVNGDTEMSADYIIAAIHPQPLFRMINTSLIRPAFQQRMAAMLNTVSCFSVYLSFKEGKMPYMNTNLFSYNQGTPWNCENYDDRTWPKGYLYMHSCHEDHAQYARTGVIICYMWMHEVNRWLETDVGRRGADYETFKHRKAEQLIDCVQRDCPGLRDAIDTYYTSSPLTYYDYTGTVDGSMYGIAKDVTNVAAHLSFRTRIPNLFLTGQNINSPGMLGVMVGAVVTSSALISADKLITQINNA